MYILPILAVFTGKILNKLLSCNDRGFYISVVDHYVFPIQDISPTWVNIWSTSEVQRKTMLFAIYKQNTNVYFNHAD